MSYMEMELRNETGEASATSLMTWIFPAIWTITNQKNTRLSVTMRK